MKVLLRSALGALIIGVGASAVVPPSQALEAYIPCSCYRNTNYMPWNVGPCVGTASINTATTCTPGGSIGNACTIGGSIDWTTTDLQCASGNGSIQPYLASTGTNSTFSVGSSQTNESWGSYSFNCVAAPATAGQWGGWIIYVPYNNPRGANPPNCNCDPSNQQSQWGGGEYWSCEK